MLKKTTVYLSDHELVLLRKMATTRNITIAEAIRQSIQDACVPRGSDEKKIWKSLEKIWAKTTPLDEKQIQKAVSKATKEVRRGKKAARRS